MVGYSPEWGVAWVSLPSEVLEASAIFRNILGQLLSVFHRLADFGRRIG